VLIGDVEARKLEVRRRFMRCDGPHWTARREAAASAAERQAVAMLRALHSAETSKRRARRWHAGADLWDEAGFPERALALRRMADACDPPRATQLTLDFSRSSA
jgi:hypothetical protein